MNKIKIGKFITTCRKDKGITQAALAEKLGISDKAVSKWETGKSIPDSSVMLELCNYLQISVNELLLGEKITSDTYNKYSEENLIVLKKENEEQTKRLLITEVVLGLISTISFLALIFITSFAIMETITRIVLIIISFIIFAVGISFCIMIEQKAGYYECEICHHKYIPTYKQVLFAMHMGRTRHMKCPKCKKRSWQKKVVLKD